MSLPYNRHLIPDARWLRHFQTPHERALWFHLRTFPRRFQRQKVIGNYIADFYCHSARLVVQVDGVQHKTILRQTADHEKSAFFNSLGLRTIRFTNSDIAHRLPWVLNRIHGELSKRLQKEKSLPENSHPTQFSTLEGNEVQQAVFQSKENAFNGKGADDMAAMHVHENDILPNYANSLEKTGEAGSSTTEAALMMIVLVPLLLYLFFAGEAGMLLLDSQEQVITSIWDYSTFPFNMSKSPNWLEYDGKNHMEQNQLAAHDRLQYADGDVSFTNEERFKDNSMDMATDYFSTLAFVQPTHCDADCMNYRHDYKDNKVHEVICWQEDKEAGRFLEGKLPLSSTEQLRKHSKGGLAVCQEKVRLKNYLLMGSFLPEFDATPLFEGDRYSRGKRIIDRRSDYKDIVVRHRAAILTDSWALTENPDEHGDTNTVALLKSSKTDGNSQFSQMTDRVLNGSLLGIPTMKAMKYMTSAFSKNLLLAVAMPTGQLSAIADSSAVDSALDKVGGVSSLAGLPNIMALSLVASYSHGGSGLDEYKYGMTGDTGDKMFTTPIRDKYADAWNARGKYYMGSSQEAQG